MTEFLRKNQLDVIREKQITLADNTVLPLLYFPLLEREEWLAHCFTTRKGGVSEGIFSSLNLSFTRGDQREAVMENFRRTAAALGADLGKFVLSDQTHTTHVRKVTWEDAGNGLTRAKSFFDTDGLITDVPGLVLSTFYADCVPLYFADPVHRAIGLSHSGWRGTVGRMGKATVEAMGREYGTDPGDLLCAIGPSICRDCYEVSQDVAEEFMREFPEKAWEAESAGDGAASPGGEEGREAESAGDGAASPGGEKGREAESAGDGAASPGGEEGTGWQERPGWRQLLTEKGGGKYQLDLWRANELVLMEAGVKPEHIAVTNICTCCNPEYLFSHRASRGKRGNLGAFLMIKEERI